MSGCEIVNTGLCRNYPPEMMTAKYWHLQSEQSTVGDSCISICYLFVFATNDVNDSLCQRFLIIFDCLVCGMWDNLVGVSLY